MINVQDIFVHFYILKKVIDLDKLNNYQISIYILLIE